MCSVGYDIVACLIIQFRLNVKGIKWLNAAKATCFVRRFKIIYLDNKCCATSVNVMWLRYVVLNVVEDSLHQGKHIYATAFTPFLCMIIHRAKYTFPV